MARRAQRQAYLTSGLLCAGMACGIIVYVSGLATTLHLGEAAIEGFLLVPALPTPLYVTMAVVILLGVSVTLLASFLQRRRRGPPQAQHQADTPRTPLQVFLSLLGSLAVLGVGVVWFATHGEAIQHLWQHLRAEVEQGLWGHGAQPFAQVSSPTTGYALFTLVCLIYGGLALLGFWALCDRRPRFDASTLADDPRVQRVRRAMRAGLRELQTHADPRQAIIACYARLEHLLEDHGTPAYRHLTPQEYMRTARRDLDLPEDAFAGLVELFELARYSLHPLDETARASATAHLERLTTHLEWGTTHAAHA